MSKEHRRIARERGSCSCCPRGHIPERPVAVVTVRYLQNPKWIGVCLECIGELTKKASER